MSTNVQFGFTAQAWTWRNCEEHDGEQVTGRLSLNHWGEKSVIKVTNVKVLIGPCWSEPVLQERCPLLGWRRTAPGAYSIATAVCICGVPTSGNICLQSKWSSEGRLFQLQALPNKLKYPWKQASRSSHGTVVSDRSRLEGGSDGGGGFSVSQQQLWPRPKV